MKPSPQFAVLIPARLHSVRLPRKLLLCVQGKSILQWTWEAAITSTAKFVAIVTGDDEIAANAYSFGANVIRSKKEHDSGTSRVAEVMPHVPREVSVIINLQGDEPCLPSFWLRLLAERLLNEDMAPIDICTLVCKLAEKHTENSSVVKVAVGASGNAMWFSRAAMAKAMHHVGIYAFRRHQLGSLPPRTTLAEAESLEQLSWLENGYKIGTVEIDAPTIAIDTAQDFAEFKSWAKGSGLPLSRQVTAQ